MRTSVLVLLAALAACAWAITPSINWVIQNKDTLMQPVYNNGVLYLMPNGNNVYPTFSLMAVDVHTQKVLWKNPPPESGTYGWQLPVYYRGMIIWTQRCYRVYCVNATTGETIWSYHNGAFQFGYALAVTDGLVIARTDAHAHILDAATGALKSKISIMECVDSAPAVFGKTMVLCGCGHVASYLIESGFQLWSNRIKTPNGNPVQGLGTPLVVGSNVIVTAQGTKLDHEGYVLSLSTQTGSIQWQHHVRSVPTLNLAYAYGKVFYSTQLSYPSNPHIGCLDVKTGNQLWTFSLGTSIFFTHPTVAYGVLYTVNKYAVSLQKQEARAINITDGTEIWTMPNYYMEFEPPTVVDGVMYASTTDDVLTPKFLIAVNTGLPWQ